MSKTWKQFERTVAKFFNTERNPLSGGNGKISRSDSLHPKLYIEDKYSVKSSLVTLFEDTDTKASLEEKLPVICTKKRGQNGFLITIHSEDIIDFMEIMNEQVREVVENVQQVQGS